MLELKNGRYVVAIWFVASTNQTMDWMAYVFRDSGGPWRFEYRFRYYEDEDAFDSKDRKNWYEGQAKDGTPLEKITETVDIIARLTEHKYGGPLWRVPIESDDPRVVMAMLEKQPWCHMQIEPSMS